MQAWISEKSGGDSQMLFQMCYMSEKQIHQFIRYNILWAQLTKVFTKVKQNAGATLLQCLFIYKYFQFKSILLVIHVQNALKKCMF